MASCRLITQRFLMSNGMMSHVKSLSQSYHSLSRHAQCMSTRIFEKNQQHTQKSYISCLSSQVNGKNPQRRSSCCMSLSVRGMAGHSKWQNIKHTKTAKDNERARIITQMTARIKAVIRETGNPDPKSNPSLARLVAEAKSKNLPNSNIDGAIAQAVKSKDTSSVLVFEGRGPGGSYFVIETCTDKPVKTKNELQNVLKKNGGAIGDQGAAKHAFDKKGVIEAGVNDKAVDMDKFVDMAIEAGAEDVTMETDESDENFLRFICEARDLYKVKKELEQREVDVKSFSVEYLPVMTVSPAEREMGLIGKIMDKLQDFPEVERVFVNVDAPES